MDSRILSLLFPPKCILCGQILAENETDLCRQCRLEAPRFGTPKIKLSFLAGWTCVWYYKDNVRRSLLRYKFHNRRSYAPAYGRLLAMRILQDLQPLPQVITWVPVSRMRRLRRGYDQVELLAKAVAAELDGEAIPTLIKIKNTRPQSGISDASVRRANILNAYQPKAPSRIAGKRILLLDDIITTGATISECAKTLLIAGAKEVVGASVAASAHEKPTNHM